MSLDAGRDGIVCSPEEAAGLRKKFGDDFYLITPGIRLAQDEKGDQKRISTPGQAIADGADFLVVGRSITTKDDVSSAIDLFLQEIERAL
ncbi:MAG: orotidine 5'-phosphate decarboxylase / HUMPS family protein [Actinomycetota bacterium]|nr:orotidine 5'-phosphate decarboxylase / HUMPS family protein [Actinomycetota bacterium]